MGTEIKVAILMATYNSSRFIDAQINSIINQSHRNWELYISDDSSDDNTLEILDSYCLKHNNIFIVNRNNKFGSALKNFMFLLSNVKSDYYMFSDHDDVWLQNKIEIALTYVLSLEKKFPQKPVLFHSDLSIVGENLNLISIWKKHNINTDFCTYFEFLSTNQIVTGCTMMINKLSKDVSFPVKNNALMHDSWIALNVAANEGIIFHLNQETICYRQHDANHLGYKKINNLIFYRFFHFFRILRHNVKLYKEANDVRKITVIWFVFVKLKCYLFRKKCIKNVFN